MIKNYTHNVIRLRKGKPSVSQVYWVIVILNKKKTSSQKQVEQLGFFMHGEEKLFSLNYARLAFYLNKGFKLNKSIKKFIYWNAFNFLYPKVNNNKNCPDKEPWEVKIIRFIEENPKIYFNLHFRQFLYGRY